MSLSGDIMFKTPKKLKKINILGKPIKIKIDDIKLAQLGAMGLFSGGDIVLLSSYESQVEFIDTFTHECFHALSYVLGTQLDPHVEEILANTMGQLQVQIINNFMVSGVFNENIQCPECECDK